MSEHHLVELDNLVAKLILLNRLFILIIVPLLHQPEPPLACFEELRAPRHCVENVRDLEDRGVALHQVENRPEDRGGSVAERRDRAECRHERADGELSVEYGHTTDAQEEHRDHLGNGRHAPLHHTPVAVSLGPHLVVFLVDLLELVCLFVSATVVSDERTDVCALNHEGRPLVVKVHGIDVLLNDGILAPEEDCRLTDHHHELGGR
mmetsp:Transcript_71925/g.203831  ORF Transcript_71925/g.203831 Transcript_71925/m.203831 type:complete len:207 (+) Transcript_71925:764-1384(+)